MSYRFYLDGVLLPVTPGRLKTTVESRNDFAGPSISMLLMTV